MSVVYSINGKIASNRGKIVGKPARPFISTWDTTQTGISGSNQIALPLEADGDYDFYVVYEGHIIKYINNYIDNVITFPDGGGVKTITIRGKIEGFRFSNDGDRRKIKSIEQFGNNFSLLDGASTFAGCINLEKIPYDLDCSGFTNMGAFAQNCQSLTDLQCLYWDVSNVESFTYAFFNTYSLNTLFCDYWNMSSCTNLRYFATGSNITSANVRNWNVSNVTNLYQAFRNSKLSVFDVELWDVSKVTNFAGFLQDANNLSREVNISNWNLSSATNLDSAFPTIKTEYYSNALIYWNTLMLQSNVLAGFNLSKYTAGAAATARQNIINNNNWTITDGGQQ